jgi:hypothetical protein
MAELHFSTPQNVFGSSDSARRLCVCLACNFFILKCNYTKKYQLLDKKSEFFDSKEL